jgi:hypothetical protein
LGNVSRVALDIEKNSSTMMRKQAVSGVLAIDTVKTAR